MQNEANQDQPNQEVKKLLEVNCQLQQKISKMEQKMDSMADSFSRMDQTLTLILSKLNPEPAPSPSPNKQEPEPEGKLESKGQPKSSIFETPSPKPKKNETNKHKRILQNDYKPFLEYLDNLIQSKDKKNDFMTEKLGRVIDEHKKLSINHDIFKNQRKLSFEKKTRFLEKQIEGSTLDITKICYTGGPCAGKTTSITKVADQLREKGYTVFIVPEAASMIFSSGGNLDMTKYNDVEQVYFQYYLMMLQMSMEDIFSGLATLNSSNKIVILCDRGIMDGKAYMSDENWDLLEEEFGLRTDKLSYDRYDLVLHLVTAAKGVPKSYDLKSNPARWESFEFAKKLDSDLQNAWAKHPKYMTIDNRTGNSFSEKLTSVSQLIFRELGDPQNLQFYKKFKMKKSNTSFSDLIRKELKVKIFKFRITDVIFFREDNDVIYFRQREQENGLATFIKCSKKFENDRYYENRRQISYREFLSMKALPNGILSKKIRWEIFYFS